MSPKIEQQIMEKLVHIEKQVDEIKEHMVDVDSIMTKEDLIAIEKAKEEKRLGALTSLGDIKKEMGL